MQVALYYIIDIVVVAHIFQQHHVDVKYPGIGLAHFPQRPAIYLLQLLHGG